MKVNKDNLVFFQGRCFPENHKKYNQFPKAWKREIRTISKIGFKYIDLIYDKKDDLFNHLDEVLIYSKKNRIKVNSVICDKFLNVKYVNSKNLFLKEIESIIKIFEKKKIPSITIPFIEKNYLDYNELIKILKKLYSIIINKKIIIFFEYNHSYKKLKKDLINFKGKILLCYDTGNALEHKRNIYEDLIKFQKIIGHIHLKDKKKINKNFKKIELGNGELNLNKFLNCINYFKVKRRKLTFETYMGKNPYLSIKKNFNLLNVN